MLNNSAAKIVLQLPQQALKFSKKQQGKMGPEDVTFIPHITLGMGILDFSNLLRVKKVLKIIAHGFNEITMKVTNRTYGELYGLGLSQSYLVIEESNKLWQLHQRVMKEFSNYMIYNTLQPGHFFDSIPADDLTFGLVENYAREFAFKQWKPVIELGEKQLTEKKLSYEFFSPKLAIWKMGYHGRLTREMFYTRMGSKRR